MMFNELSWNGLEIHKNKKIRMWFDQDLEGFLIILGKKLEFRFWVDNGCVS